ncbi:hypothetical protein QBC47DRAFT_397413 [Echria macrotheca]|uniref:Uncharacterized protein n=1 Tax=Echria macrotheca TaxID=438768 RepID=A0AAJ0BNJ5_9PEZI|nr:hypothetical protein QBC47DRAFT_397413 [Echria macrotheca]
MASDELPATLKFLTDAGHLLATSSPETSAFILRHRDELILERELTQPETQKQHVCTCCGHIMILGRGSSMSLKKEKKVKTKDRKIAKPRCGPTKTISCGHCGKVTEVQLPPPAPISRRQTKMNASATSAAKTAPTAAAPKETPQKPNANASSKKRAKSRKAGLQALLDQSKGAKQSGRGLGLSLTDFMQR